MVSLIKYGALSGGEKYNTNILKIDGLSTDTKPITTFIEYGVDGREIGRANIENGSTFTEIDTGKLFMYDAENAAWYEIVTSGGEGGGGTDNYNLLSNKPQINGTVLSGNKTSDNLGLQNKISSTNKIDSDFVSDENSANKFMSEAEKTKLASLVNYDDTEVKEDISGIETSLNNKIDKVNGKGLSTNDFTNEYKAQITTNKNGIAAVANAGAKNKLASTLDLAYLKSINRSGTWVDNVYTLDSISFTVNVDGTILVNGTPSDQTAFLLIGKSRLAKDIAAGNYILSGCPSGGGSGSNYRVFAYNPSSTVGGATDIGNGVEVHCDYSHSKEANIAIVIGANKTVDTLLFSPMLRDASIEDDVYVPYAPTNRELYEMILALQSGS